MSRPAGPPPVAPRADAPAPDGGKSVAEKNLTLVVNGLNRDDRHQQLLDLLGSEKAVARFRATALHTIMTQPQLVATADPLTLIEAVREAAVLGLEVNGLRGEGWLILYGKQAKFQPGWQGLLKILLDSGRVAAVDVQLAYERDPVFRLRQGTHPMVEHEPLLVGEKQEVVRGSGRNATKDDQTVIDRGDILGAYAWAELANGRLIVEWMSWADIEVVRRASPSVKAGRPSPWDDWWGEMARKTVLRRLMKRLPRTPKVGMALEQDNAIDELERETMERRSISSARDLALAALPGAKDQQDQQNGKETDQQEQQAAPGEGGIVVEDDEHSSGAVAGEVMEQPDAAAAEAKALACEAASPYGKESPPCFKPKSHDGLHRNTAGESWEPK